MAIFSKHYIVILSILFISLSTGLWSSEQDIIEESGEKVQEVRIQIEPKFDLDQELLRDAEQNVLRSHKTDRSWYYTLRNAYALTGEILVISSTVLDVVTVISAGLGATLYGDNEAGRACIIVAGVAEVCSIAFAKTGNHAKEASRKYAKYLRDLNDQDMGLAEAEEEAEV